MLIEYGRVTSTTKSSRRICVLFALNIEQGSPGKILKPAVGKAKNFGPCKYSINGGSRRDGSRTTRSFSLSQSERLCSTIDQRPRKPADQIVRAPLNPKHANDCFAQLKNKAHSSVYCRLTRQRKSPRKVAHLFANTIQCSFFGAVR